MTIPTKLLGIIEELIQQFEGARKLTGQELSTYGAELMIGWEIPNLCGHTIYRLRLLISVGFPFVPPRVAVWPAPPVLSWPHLEDKGLLCLLADSDGHSVEDVRSVVLRLLGNAADLVIDGVAGKNVEQFEDEFQNYWAYWKKSTALINSMCSANGPSRWVSSWHSNLGTFVSDDEVTLCQWIRHRYGESSAQKVEPQAIPLIWLPRPFHPVEYPNTLAKLLSVLDVMNIDHEMVKKLILDERGKHKTIMLGFPGRSGNGFAGLRLGEPVGGYRSANVLTKGFRGRPPESIIFARYKGFPLSGAQVQRFDAPWIHGRDQNHQQSILAEKKVIVFGVGSIGSTVGELLAKSGIGNIVLIDDEQLKTENVGRHLLGISSVGQNKAKAVAQSLSARFPHLRIDGFAKTWETFAREKRDHLYAADLIVSTMGEWQSESQLNAEANNGDDFPPLVFGWTEPHAAAGHAVVFFSGQGCLRCICDDVGHNRMPVTAWPEEGTLIRVPTCGGSFQPYGAIELANVHSLVASLAIDILLEDITHSLHRVWIGQKRHIDKVGGKWNPAWIESHGDPGAGGSSTSYLFRPDAKCPTCGQAQ